MATKIEKSKAGSAEAATPGEELRTLIKTCVSKCPIPLAKEEKIRQAKLLLKAIEQKIPPKELLKISDKEIALLYSYAHTLYMGGQYDKACELFKMLTILEPEQPDFATAVGVCHQRMKSYLNAVYAYMYSFTLQPGNPIPLFYAYECFMQLNDLASAGMAIGGVVARAADDPKYAKLKARAELLYSQLENRLALEAKTNR